MFLPDEKLLMNVLLIRNTGLWTPKIRADAVDSKELLTLNQVDQRDPAANLPPIPSPLLPAAAALIKLQEWFRCLCCARQFVGSTDMGTEGTFSV